MKSGVQPWILWGFHSLPGEQRRALGLGDDDLDVGPRLLEHLAGAGQRAAGAVAGDPVVEPLAGEVAQDLGAGRVAVVLGVGRVLELPREEPAVLLRELLGLLDHPGAALGGGREDDLRAEDPHELAALDREAVGHERDEGIALDGADHGERDARCCRRSPR